MAYKENHSDVVSGNADAILPNKKTAVLNGLTHVRSVGVSVLVGDPLPAIAIGMPGTRVLRLQVLQLRENVETFSYLSCHGL